MEELKLGSKGTVYQLVQLTANKTGYWFVLENESGKEYEFSSYEEALSCLKSIDGSDSGMFVLKIDREIVGPSKEELC